MNVSNTVKNYCTYISYAGCCDESGGQIDQYAGSGSWQHSHENHWDYIETYDGSHNITPNCTTRISQAISAGAGHAGILIGDWMLGHGAGEYMGLLGGGDTICYWGGYADADPAGSSQIVGHAQSMIAAAGGTTKTGAGGAPLQIGSGGGSSTATVAYAPVINCPCRQVWIGWPGGKDGSVDAHNEFKVKLIGVGYYLDNSAHTIPNKPYTGKMELWCKNPAGKSWLMTDFWPDKNGNFAFYIGSDGVEERQYSVCFV
jgi:hypothetical protein